MARSFRPNDIFWILPILCFMNHVKCQANFGDNIDQVGFGGDVVSKNEDNRFADMGQVTKDTFDVAGGLVTLTLNVQDTIGIKEFWIIDFEPYRYNVDQLPVDEGTGRLIAANTGPCSNVYEDQDFNTYLSDDYFQNRTAVELGAKDLFTEFTRGTVETNQTRRNNKIHFKGSMATWFDCTESDGQTKVWQLTSDASSADELEYRTMLYAINVRPKDEKNDAAGLSFVQSSIELIWRLSRTAISKLIISSTALLQPVVEFVRVSAVFDNQGEPIATQAHLHIRFRTVVDSEDQMVTYVQNSLVYIADSESLSHGLRVIISEPPSAIFESPWCEFLLDQGTGQQVQCNQLWEFKVILDIDVTGHEENRSPIDASGVFEFSFSEYTCVNASGGFDINECGDPIDGDPAKVALLLTIQTVVFIQDEEEDQIAIMLVALKGADNQELSVEGARGIAHKENVTLEVKFSPAILRADYTLDLQLFMVCRGEEYVSDQYPHGCLHAPSLDRYVAYVDEQFSYTPRIYNTSGVFEGTPYDFSHVENDFLQDLAFEGYVEEDEFQRPLPVPVHRSTFVNLALSGESQKYVITNVYRLVEKSARKRRRDATIIAKTVVNDDHAVSFFHGHPFFQRYRRDIDDSVREQHGQRYAYTSMGCPPGATHKYMDCHCPAGTEYSARSFQCEIDNSVVTNEIVEIEKEVETNIIEEVGESGACVRESSVVVTVISWCVLVIFWCI
ncbi:uncharacterized protein [Amphiura filiformis]|uniref:uncharacterized protein n=1 Tax=Amphiura filiformis TaxID=82378 RepID=UPI003B21FB59